MALIVGPITGIDDDPQRAVAQAPQPAIGVEYIIVTPVEPPPGLDGPAWRWTLVNGAPPVQDPEVTVHPGAVEQGGCWRPTTQATHAEIRAGLVLSTEHGFVVVGIYQGEDDDITELAEAALAHVAALFGSE